MRLTQYITILFIFSFCVLGCKSENNKGNLNRSEIMIYTEHDILNELDGAFHSEISKYYPKGNSNDIKYIFFLDLEHGYCEAAGSRIHLYADSVNWAIVFEKSGYQNRGNYADIELDYVGNCIKYITDEFDG